MLAPASPGLAARDLKKIVQQYYLVIDQDQYPVRIHPALQCLATIQAFIPESSV